MMKAIPRSETESTRASQTAARDLRAKTVLVTGSTGLVGSALMRRLGEHGAIGRRIVRGEGSADAIQWDPTGGGFARPLPAADAIVHLAGESIAEGRWTPEKKERIRESRVLGTRILAEELAQMPEPPKVFVCASAIGFYGDRGEELLTESSRSGEGFLADVCREWEEAAEPARAAGIRVVHVRIGVVLAKEGGALAKMLTPFKLGAGGKLGSGDQYMSWISLDDLVGVLERAIIDEELEGPVNGTAPLPVTNREFTKTLGRVLRRPTILPMPAPMARLAFGEMADELLLSSMRVIPKRLMDEGHSFQHADLETALHAILRAS